MTSSAGSTDTPAELRQAIVDGRISIDHAIRAIVDSVAFQAPVPQSTQLVLDRLAVLQSTIEMKLEAACPIHSKKGETRSPLLLSFLENWHLIALVAVITSIETACLTYLLAG